MFAKFLKDESGATAIEYGILAAMIALVVIGGATMLGTTLNKFFEGISSVLSAKTPSV